MGKRYQDAQMPGTRRVDVVCRCCKGKAVTVTGGVVTHKGESAAPVRCDSCGFSWLSKNQGLLRGLQ